MREYETTVIVQPEISSEGTETILQRMDGALESSGAQRLMCADLGKRKLAYEIEKFQKGHYYVLSYLDDGKVVGELERILRIEESVLRFMTVKVEDDVRDIEARKAAAAEAEAEQQKRAAEKAAREAEEAAAREEVERQTAEAARQAAEEPGDADDEDSDDAEDSDDSDDDDSADEASADDDDDDAQEESRS